MKPTTTWLRPVKLATTKHDGDIPVGTPWSGRIDGRTVALADRVLLAHQRDLSKRGIYEYVDGAKGPQLVGPVGDIPRAAAVLVLDGEALALTEQVQHEPGVWDHRRVIVVKAAGDGETDDTAAVREALAGAFASGARNPTFYLRPTPEGYRIDGEIEVREACTILGHATKIIVPVLGQSVFRVTGSFPVAFCWLRLECIGGDHERVTGDKERAAEHFVIKGNKIEGSAGETPRIVLVNNGKHSGEYFLIEGNIIEGGHGVIKS